jgi:hypothetical protein
MPFGNDSEYPLSINRHFFLDQAELNGVCDEVSSTVVEWLSRQDDVTKAIHRTVIDIIQDFGDADVDVVMKCLRIDHPNILDDYCECSVYARVRAFLRTEFKELSAVFSKRFDDYNIRYFGNSLPRYRVAVMRNLLVPRQIETPFVRYDINVRLRKIAMSYNGWPEEMLSMLLDRMCRLRTGASDEAAWGTEMNRLLSIGAPTYEAVDSLRKTGWPLVRSARRASVH